MLFDNSWGLQHADWWIGSNRFNNCTWNGLHIDINKDGLNNVGGLGRKGGKRQSSRFAKVVDFDSFFFPFFHDNSSNYKLIYNIIGFALITALIQIQYTMQLSGSKLLIWDRPIADADFPQLTKLQSTQKLDLQDMRTPIVTVLFGYKAGPEFFGFQLELQLQLMIKGEKISHRNVAQKRRDNFIYKCVEIDSCLCYEKLITAVITIKYAQNQQCQQVSSVQQLCQMLSKRQFVIYSEKTLSTYKRDIIVKQPVNSLYRYSAEGYIWMKCSNLNIEQITIYKIQLMNWLVKTNQQLKLFQSKSSMSNKMVLKKQQSIGVMLSAPKYLCKQQIPCMIKFSLPQCPQYAFKMIKYLYIS